MQDMLQVDVSCQAVSMQLPADASPWQDGAVYEGLVLEAGRCMLGCHFNITWVCPYPLHLYASEPEA